MEPSSMRENDIRPLFRVSWSYYSEDICKNGDVVEGVLMEVDSSSPALGFYPPSNKKGAHYYAPLFAGHAEYEDLEADLIPLTKAAFEMVQKVYP